MKDDKLLLKELLKNDNKVYVTVQCEYISDGTIRPLSFVWENGKRYEIDKVLDVRPAASFVGGGTGMRYTVVVKNKQTCLWLEEDRQVFRWFMEKKGK